VRSSQEVALCIHPSICRAPVTVPRIGELFAGVRMPSQTNMGAIGMRQAGSYEEREFVTTKPNSLQVQEPPN
jgi:hypothetical protein